MSDEENKAYCEGIKAGWILIRADLDRKMNIFDALFEEMLNKKETVAFSPIQFVEELKERAKRPTKEGEVNIVMGDNVDFLSKAIGYAFICGVEYMLKKTEMHLNQEILKKMETIWGEKNTPHKTWDASKFDEN